MCCIGRTCIAFVYTSHESLTPLFFFLFFFENFVCFPTEKRITDCFAGWSSQILILWHVCMISYDTRNGLLRTCASYQFRYGVDRRLMDRMAAKTLIQKDGPPDSFGCQTCPRPCKTSQSPPTSLPLVLIAQRRPSGGQLPLTLRKGKKH